MSVHRRNRAFVRSVAPGEVGARPKSNLFASQNIDTITTIRQAFVKIIFIRRSQERPISLEDMARPR